MTQQIEVLDALPGSGKTYAILEYISKNKDIIITYDFLTKYNLGEATELIGHKKKVYLIDKEDISWFSIKLLEVKVIGTWKQSIE